MIDRRAFERQNGDRRAAGVWRQQERTQAQAAVTASRDLLKTVIDTAPGVMNRLNR